MGLGWFQAQASHLPVQSCKLQTFQQLSSAHALTTILSRAPSRRNAIRPTHHAPQPQAARPIVHLSLSHANLQTPCSYCSPHPLLIYESHFSLAVRRSHSWLPAGPRNDTLRYIMNYVQDYDSYGSNFGASPPCHVELFHFLHFDRRADRP